MRKSLSASAFMALSLAFAQGVNAEPLGIGDARMGMPIEDVFKNQDVVCRPGGMIYKYTICNNPISIRSKPVQARYHFDSNELVSILLELDHVNYEAIRDELKEEWGEPSLQETEKSSFAMEWNLPAGVITMAYDWERKNSGSARMTSREGIERYAEKMKDYLPK